MAVFNQPTPKMRFFWDLSALPTPPEGTHVATCVEIHDEFGVVRPKYKQPDVMETVDQTAFLFGFRDASGTPFKVASKPMTISGFERAPLYLFLQSWLGRPFPFGQDYAAPVAQGGMKGRQAVITINHQARKDGNGFYPIIVAISPVPTGYVAGNTAQAPAQAHPAPGNGGYGNGGYSHSQPVMPPPPAWPAPPAPLAPVFGGDEVPF